MHLVRAEELRFAQELPALGTYEMSCHVPGTDDNGPVFPRNQRLPQVHPPQQQIRAELSINRRSTFDINVNIDPSSLNARQYRENADHITQQLTSLVDSIPRFGQGRGTPVHTTNTLVRPHHLREMTPNTSIQPSSGRKRTLTIGGRTLVYSEQDIQWPEGVISFTDNVDRLFREWYSSSTVRLLGVGVPLRYWSDLYQGIRSDSWSALKKPYSEWKVRLSRFPRRVPSKTSFLQTIMMAYEHFASETAFWHEYSVLDEKTGSQIRFNWTRLVQSCRRTLRERDARDAQLAKAEYGDSFKELFSYKKSGETKVLSNPLGIAERYRALKAARAREQNPES